MSFHVVVVENFSFSIQAHKPRTSPLKPHTSHHTFPEESGAEPPHSKTVPPLRGSDTDTDDASGARATSRPPRPL